MSKAASQVPEWMTDREFASWLTLSLVRLRQDRRDGYGPPFVRAAAVVGYHVPSVQEWFLNGGRPVRRIDWRDGGVICKVESAQTALAPVSKGASCLMNAPASYCVPRPGTSESYEADLEQRKCADRVRVRLYQTTSDSYREWQREWHAAYGYAHRESIALYRRNRLVQNHEHVLTLARHRRERARNRLSEADWLLIQQAAEASAKNRSKHRPKGKT